MQAAKTECGSWSFSTSSGRRRRPPSTGRTRIRMRSGEARRSGRNWPRGAEGHSGGGGLFSSFLQETPGRPLEDFDVLDVDETPPHLDDSLVLQVSEGPCHRLPI